MSVSRVCVRLCLLVMQRGLNSQHMGVVNHQLLPILPYGSLLARSVNRMLMCTTSGLCVCFYLVSISVPFSCIVVCVTSAGNESHPPIADEDKGTDKLYRLLKPKMLENIQTLLKLFALFLGDNDRLFGTNTVSCK